MSRTKRNSLKPLNSHARSKRISTVAPISIQCHPSSSSFPRDGARNRSDRVSSELDLQQCRNVETAVHRAMEIGLPLNRFVTVHFGKLGLPDSVAAKMVTRLFKLLRDWLRSKRQKSTAIWIRENGTTEGSHVHILFHLPKSVTWAGWLGQRWCRSLSGTYRKGAWVSKEIWNIRGVLDYILKGADLAAAHELGLSRLKAGGTIIGKRCGGTENIWPGGGGHT